MKITVMEAAGGGEQDEQKNDDLLLQQHDHNESPLSTHFIYRHIVTIDEKYLRRCLELIYLSASSHQSSWEHSAMTKKTLFSFDLQNPSVESIMGSVNRSKSILNILKNPLIDNQYISPAIESSSSSISVYSNRTTNGILRVKWDSGSGSHRYEFWFDDRKEAEYVAELVKPDQSPDCIYVFRGNQSEIVGRMRLSTSVTLGFKETEFVLFGSTDVTPTRINQVVKKKGFSRKFKRGNFDSVMGLSKQVDLSESHFSSNLQLAAIVFSVRDQEEEKSGWGMKFLKKNKTNGSSLDIVVASGTHGGPNGGPLGLTERWRSSGQCDCGGWDIGCPIKVLKTRENQMGNSKSFDLFIEGSSEVGSRVAMKMVNVNDSLLLIEVDESTISILQMFAIAVSIIHIGKYLESRLLNF